jgi:hypothetical protein
MKEFPLLRVPRVAEQLTRRRVLVLEYVEGRKLTEVEARNAELADELWRAYLKQILVDGAFHCDPHPGNFLFDDDGKLAVLTTAWSPTFPREPASADGASLVWWSGTGTGGSGLSRVGIPGDAAARFRTAVVTSWPATRGHDEGPSFGSSARSRCSACATASRSARASSWENAPGLASCRSSIPISTGAHDEGHAVRLVEEQFRRDISVESSWFSSELRSIVTRFR